MTVPPRRPTSTHRMGSALNDPAAPLPRFEPARPSGTPVGNPDIESVILDHLDRAISQSCIDVMANDTAPFLAAKVLAAPAGKALLEWVNVLAQAKVREQAQKAERVEKMAEDLARASIDAQPGEAEDLAREAAAQSMEGEPEMIARARIGEDRTGGESWEIDRDRLATFLRMVPDQGATIHAYMEDLSEHGDLQALCLEAAWTPRPLVNLGPPPTLPLLAQRIALYQENNRRSNLADPGGLY